MDFLCLVENNGVIPFLICSSPVVDHCKLKSKRIGNHHRPEEGIREYLDGGEHVDGGDDDNHQPLGPTFVRGDNDALFRKDYLRKMQMEFYKV